MSGLAMPELVPVVHHGIVGTKAATNPPQMLAAPICLECNQPNATATRVTTSSAFL
jgi:hypothetical protein